MPSRHALPYARELKAETIVKLHKSTRAQSSAAAIPKHSILLIPTQKTDLNKVTKQMLLNKRLLSNLFRFLFNTS